MNKNAEQTASHLGRDGQEVHDNMISHLKRGQPPTQATRLISTGGPEM